METKAYDRKSSNTITKKNLYIYIHEIIGKWIEERSAGDSNNLFEIAFDFLDK
jgi:hypothetical protein